MITSKLTSKAQTTIPLPVRHALHLAVGDQTVYTIDGRPGGSDKGAIGRGRRSFRNFQ